jgi:hypothetical protein
MDRAEGRADRDFLGRTPQDRKPAVDLDAEETMRLLKWVVIIGFIGVCVLLLVSKDDIRRMRQMRQM